LVFGAIIGGIANGLTALFDEEEGITPAEETAGTTCYCT